MSIHVHRNLRLVPVERKRPHRPLVARLIPRRRPRTLAIVHRKEKPPCPPK